MPYSSFSIAQIKEEFGIVIQEGKRFLPIGLPTIPVSPRLQGILEDLPWAIAVGTEKALGFAGLFAAADRGAVGAAAVDGDALGVTIGRNGYERIIGAQTTTRKPM
jgi:hypothetical protein